MSSSTKTGSTTKAPTGLDPALMPVIAKRFDAIVREMGSTLLRAGRSAVFSVAWDFSCSIVTADVELLAAAEGLPVHIFGSQLQTAEMRRRHPDLRPGDAFLDNDPYTGNSHHADHTILVEVYGEELIEEFVREWLDYSERRMEHAIGGLRSGTFVRESQHDSIGELPAIPLKASVTVDAEARRVQIDLRDNPDCVAAGLNLTRATASNMAIAGLFGNVDPDIPANSGSFRRVEV